MSARNSRRVIFLILLLAIFPTAHSQTSQKPITKSELLALVAGNALSENIIHEVQTRGLAFHPNEGYKSQLTLAGANPELWAAVASAKATHASGVADGPTETELQNHLSAAGNMVRTKQYDEATRELTSALQAGAHTEAGFVMGEVLGRQQQFDFAVNVYRAILHEDADFPEARTKLAYALYRIDEQENAIQEAKSVLRLNPDNAEAHKNLGLALMALKKFDASIAEYREALRIKPDYAAVHFDLGIAFYNQHDSAAAILEYKKANTLDPENADWHYNLGALLNDTGDTTAAIQEYRVAKRLSPGQIDIRHNLARALVDVDPEASIREFRELVAMAPDFELGHIGLGLALSRSGDEKGAEVEYRTAAALDPSDTTPHMNLGVVLERQQKYEAALNEFTRAAELDENSGDAHLSIGRILLQRKDYVHAIGELRAAERLEPSSWKPHSALAEAFAGSGDLNGAIVQGKQALMLDPKNVFVMSELAPLLEKNGDTVGALEQYRRAADITRADKERDEYAAAQQRFKEKIGSMRAAGKNSEAAELEARAGNHSSDLESQWLDKVEASRKAMSEQRLVDAEKSAKEELALAEKLLPVDDRLLQSIFDLAWAYSLQKKFPEAQTEWQHQLSVSQKIFGPESQQVVHALESLAGNSYLQKDYGSAVSFYARAIELNEKIFGATDQRVFNDLFWLAASYREQGAFEKAEPILLRLLQVNEASGKTTPILEANMLQLAKLYLAWGKFDKAEPYCRKSLDMREQWYGPNSPVLADPLQTLSEILTKLGKSDEAAQLKKRHDTIMNAATQAVAKP